MNKRGKDMDLMLQSKYAAMQLYLGWALGKYVENMSPEEFRTWWEGLTDTERQVKWDAASLHPDFD